MILRILALLLIAAQLVGCNSGSQAPDAHTTDNSAVTTSSNTNDDYVHFEGIWQGTITPDDTMTTGTAIVLVNGWGEFRLLTRDTQFIGFPRRTTTELSGGLTGLRSPDSAWSDGTLSSRFTITGSIDGDNFINATYDGDVGGGSLALAWEPGAHSTDIMAIEGTWVGFDDHLNMVVTFDFGNFSTWESSMHGTHSNGCTYSGNIESWTSLNSYDIWELEISGCPNVAGTDMNGEYSGTAALVNVVDDGSNNLALVLGLSSDEIQLSYFLYRL